MPRISKDVKGNVVNMSCAFIKPHSKKVKEAIKYLEAIAEHPFDAITDVGTALFFIDISIYADAYDISQPAFMDVFDIMSNGIISNVSFNPSDTIINDYISGKLTLNEAVAKIQREAEMWLNE